jgi:hypothetical protein
VQARSGGHSYANYGEQPNLPYRISQLILPCAGLGGIDGAVVVDMVNFQKFEMNYDTWRAIIGSGTLLGSVKERLYRHGRRAMAHGSCPQVGIGG